MKPYTNLHIVPIIQNYLSKMPVKQAWLFGSYARGEENETSDIDLLLRFDYSQHIGLQYFGMRDDLRVLLGHDVDIVSEKYLMPFAKESANRDKILIYERKE